MPLYRRRRRVLQRLLRRAGGKGRSRGTRRTDVSMRSRCLRRMIRRESIPKNVMEVKHYGAGTSCAGRRRRRMDFRLHRCGATRGLLGDVSLHSLFGDRRSPVRPRPVASQLSDGAAAVLEGLRLSRVTTVWPWKSDSVFMNARGDGSRNECAVGARAFSPSRRRRPPSDLRELRERRRRFPWLLWVLFPWVASLSGRGAM